MDSTNDEGNTNGSEEEALVAEPPRLEPSAEAAGATGGAVPETVMQLLLAGGWDALLQQAARASEPDVVVALSNWLRMSMFNKWQLKGSLCKLSLVVILVHVYAFRAWAQAEVPSSQEMPTGKTIELATNCKITEAEARETKLGLTTSCATSLMMPQPIEPPFVHPLASGCRQFSTASTVHVQA